jgi:hypothetical protein
MFGTPEFDPLLIQIKNTMQVIFLQNIKYIYQKIKSVSAKVQKSSFSTGDL